MIVDSIMFQGHRCFKKHWAGFDQIKPINVIIGRNNTGKSHLLDLAEALCQEKLQTQGWRYRFRGILDELSIKVEFPIQGVARGLYGDLWQNYGSQFVGVLVEWETDERIIPLKVEFPLGQSFKFPGDLDSKNLCDKRIRNILQNFSNMLSGSVFRRLLADRDIRPETAGIQLALGRDGHGASNIIRRYLVTANPGFPREIIQTDLLSALNLIFGNDGKFTEIQVKVHDDDASGRPDAHWEVFLGEEKKGLIPLSRSGSGLKTVLLVLLNLLVIPKIDRKPKSKFTFAFEELENNLHPALLRRLFQYLENYAVTEKATIFMTTHSSTALDVFGLSKNAQIIHVSHDGDTARTTTVSAHFDHLGVISELGAKPSDLLQANGIIWVEGPSDCIYINRWLDVFTSGRLQEGRDYQCAFYGGSLLARTQFASPEEAEKELVNLFRVNSNIVVVCDGDRTAKGKRVKDRVRRIRSEVLKIPGAHIWVTQAREIENYIPGSVLAKAVGVTALRDPDQYEIFFPRKGSPGTSYLESIMNRKGMDKMELAILNAREMTMPLMNVRFDWNFQMQKIVDSIDSWNR